MARKITEVGQGERRDRVGGGQQAQDVGREQTAERGRADRDEAERTDRGPDDASRAIDIAARER